MIPKKRTQEEENEMNRLMEIASERALTHQEQKAYFMLLGYDEQWAEQLVSQGFPTE